ncbi:uncharacterized protein LOC111006279 [Momordica charantia]|uniref:Uncharacterized protein LOC111006279 n=1 Tax=Momordica charantia TaxID=3673 RepID=A0A6J1C0A7_MOMCH|nr:uncharacterized protein LOC111006279 [Momordica charantia]
MGHELRHGPKIPKYNQNLAPKLLIPPNRNTSTGSRNPDRNLQRASENRGSLLRSKQMSTIFIAVQCFQCSTMQVKQQRRSGNKWNCAVCNEKQSVQKVFARAPMAKDVRKFVQSFNMSRKYADEQKQVEEIVLVDGVIVDDGQLACSTRKRRSDWSAYLDLEEDRSQSGRGNEPEIGSDFADVEIVTELPEVRASKSKLTCRSSWSEDGSRNGVLEPNFSKRKLMAKDLSSQDEIRNWESPSKWKQSISEDEEKARTKACIMAKIRGPSSSKWSEYITEEDNNGENMATEPSMDILKTMTNDEMVEDDIHPDFK